MAGYVDYRASPRAIGLTKGSEFVTRRHILVGSMVPKLITHVNLGNFEKAATDMRQLEPGRQQECRQDLSRFCGFHSERAPPLTDSDIAFFDHRADSNR